MSDLERETSVLVVDDEEPVRGVISAGLIKRGYTVTAARNGQEALEKAACQRFDVVLLDVKMPGLTGMEVLRRIRETDGDVLVMMLTAVADPDLVIESTAMDLGAYRFLTKPIRLADLHVAIQDALAQWDPGTSVAPPVNTEKVLSDPAAGAKSSIARSILVVDDEDAIRAVLTGALTREGHSVSQAATGDEALIMVAQQQFDVMLLDIRMPGMSGIEVLREMVARYPDTAVVMLTTAINNAEEAESKALQLGAMGLLSKPCTLHDVRETVRHVCDGKLSPRPTRIP